MATENIPQLDKMIKDLGNKISKITVEKQKDVEEEILRLRRIFESEEKSMLHNVTVKHEENKVLVRCWEMEAAKLDYNTCAFPSMPVRCVQDRKYIDHEPMPDEIAQFLSDSKADFVSVVQNYRFESELPF